MAVSARSNHLISPSSFSRLQTLIFDLQRLNHTLGRDGDKARFCREVHSDSLTETSGFDISKWKKVDSTIFGLNSYSISPSSRIVLKVLQNQGFEAYLVGGCVRDLLLKKTPKDFDVITTAKLSQIKKQFHHCIIVGRRFPICRVNIKGSVVEVSSFETVNQRAEKKETVLFSQMPTGCDKQDFVRWRNCLNRDFTINSLFYDPFMNKIYDYANGMRDLRSCKVRTVIPAQVSFKEDCARILRGLRITARLGLSFSKETATAIRNLSSSIMVLDKARLMMELNFMLSYGAAERSLCLLGRFKLLEILLPIHAAYLAQHGHNQSAQSSLMLMKLFSSVDNFLSCDRPSDCSLWVGLLSFHLALVNNPQDALVVWAFASVLYHGKWREAVNFARENAQMHVQFLPEISEASATKSDEALAEDIIHLASLVKSSIDALTEERSLLQSMARYPNSPCSGLVFISKKVGQKVAELFDVLLSDIKLYVNKRESFEIDYRLLGKGNPSETRFVLGKVIMDTMSSGVIQEQQIEAVEEELHLPSSYLEKQQKVVEKEKDHLPLSYLEQQLEMVKEKDCSPQANTEQRQKVLKNCLLISNTEQCPLVITKEKHQVPVSICSSIEQQREADEKDGPHPTLSGLFFSSREQLWEVVKENDCSPQQTNTEQPKVFKENCLPISIAEPTAEQCQKVLTKEEHCVSVSNIEQQCEADENDRHHPTLSSLFLSNQEQVQEVVKVKGKYRVSLSSLFM